MKKIFLLSAEHIDVAREEVLALAGTDEYWDFENILVCDADFRFDRLAMTRKVYDYLFECTYENLTTVMARFDWKKIYKNNFSLRITNIGPASLEEKEAELAKYIWRRVNAPRVDLKHTQTKIEVIVTEHKIFVGKVCSEGSHDFNKRRPQCRPCNHPTTLKPKLARACINLTGIHTGKVLVDPFCGCGGILIEGGLMRFNTVGYDISDKMLTLCEKNLDYFKIKRFRLEKQDATHISNYVDYVVTDLPYGKGSYISREIETLYLDFLNNLEKILRFRAVIIFPSTVNHKKILNQTRFIVKNEFSVYVHKSLNRNIVVLEKHS